MSTVFPSTASKHLPEQNVDTLGLFNHLNIPSVTVAQRSYKSLQLFKDTSFFGYNTDRVHNWSITPRPLAKQFVLSYN